MAKTTKTTTLTNNIAETIKHDIYNGKIPPDHAILEKEIAKRFNASNIPVREAFRILEGEGIIIHEKFSGYKVRKVSADEMMEFYDLVRFFSRQLLARGIPRYTDLDYRHFGELITKLNKSKNPDEIVHLFRELVLTAFTPAGLHYSLEITMMILHRNTTVIHGMIEKIYKNKWPTAYLKEFVTMCRKGETEKAIDIWMEEYDRRTKNFAEIISTQKK